MAVFVIALKLIAFWILITNVFSNLIRICLNGSKKNHVWDLYGNINKELVLFCFTYSILGISHMLNKCYFFRKEICDPKLNFTMCPLCDFQCPYWSIQHSCSNAIASRMFDNGGTVFFAIFMSFWGKFTTSSFKTEK